MIRLKKTMILLLYFLSPLPLIAIAYLFNPAAYETSKGLLPMVLGAIAYTWLLAELVISARPKFIEKYFGLNRFYQFHGAAAIVAIALSFLHKQLEDAIWGGFLHTARQIGDIAFILFIALAVFSLIFMTGAVVRRVPPLASIRHWLEKSHFINFRWTVWLHNANVIAVILIFIHVFILSAFYQQNFWICGIYTLYFMIAFGSYVYHKVLKNSLVRGHKYTLAAVREESDNIHTLVFTPERGAVPPFKPGQFVFLRLLGGGVPKEAHPFSITSSPADRSQLSVTIKSVGDYTNAIPSLSTGIRAVFEGPYGVLGNSTFRSKADLVLIAGGIGITPMLSILKNLSEKDRERRVMLLWNISTKKDFIFRQTFSAIAEQMPRFTFVPILSKEKNFQGETGRLTQETIARLLADYHIPIDRSHYIVCGPPKMMASVIHSLQTLHVSRKNIHFENFSL